MVIIKSSAGLRKWIDAQGKTKEMIGFVPTMGALHAGHISLVNTSQKESALTVCSIFVNPAQFNDPTDFEKYPSTLEADIDRLEMAGCDLLFLPSVEEIYPLGWGETKHYDLGILELILEGAFRPGHFQGVCRVVERLLQIVQPGRLYLGQKDYQQCMVIARLIDLMDLTGKIEIRVCPTLRESDGLAMSSRNMRLNKEEREKAVLISRVLKMIKEQIRPGDISGLVSSAEFILADEGFRVDYVIVADRENLNEVNVWDGNQKLVALAAAYLDEVRLIDNMIL
jgi:pantoate--beta-alanine ligase